MDYFNKLVLEKIKSELGGTNAGSVIFLGCGMSELPMLLFKNFETDKFDMLDYNPLCVERQKENFKNHANDPRLRIFQGDLTDDKLIDILKPPYKILIFTEVLEHIPDDEKTLSFLRKISGADSAMIMTVPCGRIDRMMLKINPGYMRLASGKCGHVHFYSAEDIKKLADKCGFEISDHMTIHARYTLYHLALNLGRVSIDGDFGGVRPANFIEKAFNYAGSVAAIFVGLPIVRNVLDAIIPRNLFFVMKTKKK